MCTLAWNLCTLSPVASSAFRCFWLSFFFGLNAKTPASKFPNFPNLFGVVVVMDVHESKSGGGPTFCRWSWREKTFGFFTTKARLGGGFKLFFIFTPILGEMIQFRLIFQMDDSTTKQKATLVWNGGYYTKSWWYDEEVDWNSIKSPVATEGPGDLSWSSTMKPWKQPSWVLLGSNGGLSKNTVSKIGIHWIYLPDPTHERFTTRRIIDFSRGIPNYKPLFATGCYWVWG